VVSPLYGVCTVVSPLLLILNSSSVFICECVSMD
jgi:hypothetical protein